VKFGKFVGNGIDTLDVDVLILSPRGLKILQSIKGPGCYAVKLGGKDIQIQVSPRADAGSGSHVPVEEK
jgi:hypothetical protein